MNAKEIRENSLPELNEKLAELKDELYKLRFQHAINQLDNPMDSLHSSDRNFFNIMYGDKDLIPILRDMIDGFLLKFESELLKPQVNITLKDIGFSNY